MPVPAGTIQGIFDAVKAEAAAAPPVVETPAAAEPAPAVEAAAETPPVVETPVVVSAAERINVIRSQAVPLSTHRAALREQQKVQSQLDASTQRLAALETQLAQALAAQKPAAAAVAAAEAQTDEQWLQQMLDAGAEIPPALLDGLQKTLAKVEALEKQVGQHGKHFASAQEQRDNSSFDSEFSRLQARVPGIGEEQLLEMLTNHIDPRHIVQLYDQMVVQGTPAPAAKPAQTGPRPSAPPPVIATGVPAIDTLPDDYKITDYRKWASDQLRH